MNVVAELAEIVRDHGVTVLVGSTIVLGGIAAVAAATRSVVAERQLLRWGLVAGGLYLLVALVPLPRWSLPDPFGTRDGAGPVVRVALPPAAFTGDVANAERGSPSRDDTVTSEPLPAREPPRRELPARQPLPLESSATRSTEPRAPSRAPAAAPVTIAAAEKRGSAAFDVAEWLAITLLIGSGLVALHAGLGWWRLRRLLARCRRAPASLIEALDTALPRGTRLWVADGPVRPFCVGVLRRHVVVPPELARPTAAARFVLRHELAHVSTGDTRWCALESLLRPVLCWQPLFWWLRARLRFCDELLADDAAASGDASGYVRAMLALSCGDRQPVRGAQAAFVFQRPTELYRRCQMILQRENVLKKSMSVSRRAGQALGVSALLAVAAASFGVERVVAQDPGAARELRAEVNRLRAENEKLRELLENAVTKADPEGSGDARGALWQLVHGGAISSAAADLLASAARDDLLAHSAADELLAGAMSEAVKLVRYTVKEGDTLASIARTFYADEAGLDRIRRLNPGLDPRQLVVGTAIVVAADPESSPGDPAASGESPADPGERVTYRVRKGDSLHRIANQFFRNRDGVDRLRRLNPGLDPDRLRVGQVIVIAGDPATVAESEVPPGAIDPTQPRPEPAGSLGSTRGRSLDDVARVVTRCIELRGEVRIAEIELARAERGKQNGVVDPFDLEIARIRLETSKAQLDAITNMLETELEAAQAELQRLQALANAGAIGRHEVAEVSSFVQVLLGVF